VALSEEMAAKLAESFDEEMNDAKVVRAMLSLIEALTRNHPENKQRFLDMSMVGLLDLCAKVHKKDAETSEKINSLLTMLS
jgi:hypothetical protein